MTVDLESKLTDEEVELLFNELTPREKQLISDDDLKKLKNWAHHDYWMHAPNGKPGSRHELARLIKLLIVAYEVERSRHA